jgi:glutamate-1-semialdehyde 2,1-aminomutase
MTWTNSKDSALRERAMAVIPNGMYGHQSVMLLPDDYPQFFDRGPGRLSLGCRRQPLSRLHVRLRPQPVRLWPCRDRQAYVERMRQGDTMTGPGQAMVELAEALVAMVSHADWAMFCKNGTDATTMAMMIARNFTPEEDHRPGQGRLSRRRALVHAPEERRHPRRPRQSAVLRLQRRREPGSGRARGRRRTWRRSSPRRSSTTPSSTRRRPTPEYARRARELCDEHGALLIVDDVRAGFRLARDCSWSLVGVKPDLSTWGKAIANGHPISALLGADIARFAAATIYATGSFWFSAAPMAAALATLKLIARPTIWSAPSPWAAPAHRPGRGRQPPRLWPAPDGPAQLPLIMIDDDPTGAKGYFWNNALLKRGVYFHPWHNMFINTAMTEGDIDHALQAADDAFKLLKAAGPLEPVAKLEFMHSMVG